ENKELKDWVYYPSWKRLVQSAGSNESDTRRSYLFFSTDNNFSDRLTTQLAQDGQDVIEVCCGNENRQLAENRYQIEASMPFHFDWLLSELSAAGFVITDILYAWGIGVEPQPNQAYFGLVYLVQSLLRAGMLQEKRIAVLTEGLHKVLGTETGHYNQSLLLGLVNVLPQEYSVTCFNIDLLPSEPLDQWIPQLAAAIREQEGRKERIVALRHGQRWIQDFQKNTQVIKSVPGKIKRGGVYLITGGLGNVGFVLSKYLLQQYDAKLVITGRSALELLRGKNLTHYQILKGMNAEVSYWRADVADNTQMKQVVAEVEQETGRIDGVIHAAGIIDDHYFELIEDITPANALAMLAPKVKGIENIYQVFRERNPDFVWITSSLSTVLGGLGFSSYAAANLYMDHFLLSRLAELPTWRIIGLGGMAFSKEELQKESGLVRFALKPDEVTALFEWSLGNTGCPVMIQTVEDLSTRMHRVYEVKKETYLNGGINETVEYIKTERAGLSTIYITPGTGTEKKLAVLFENFFGIESIGIEDNFFELGGDSLKAMMLLKRIKNEFDSAITLTDFLKNTTLRLLAAKIDERIYFAASTVKTDNEIVI
ncbi:SDR family NAD(P)-dependent oxidoreductase, partial [Niastella yeongjuensis]